MNAFNFVTYKEYAGRNSLLKGKGKYNAFATFNQIKENGYRLNKNAKGKSIFCGYKQISELKNGKLENISVPKYAVVFDIADTNALENKDLVFKLENEKRIPSELEMNTILIGELLWKSYIILENMLWVVH